MSRFLIGGAALALVLFVADRCYQQAESEFEQRVSRVQEQVRQEAAVAESHKERADSLERALAKSVAALDSVQPVIEERIVRIREETHDTIRILPAVTGRDSIINDLQKAVKGWQSAYNDQKRAADLLRQSLTVVTMSRDSLSALVEDRPRPPPWYLPEVRVGPSAGVCSDGTGCLQPIGIQISWKLRL